MREFALIIVVLISVVQADYYPIRIQGIDCKKESDLVYNITCNLKAINRTTKFIDVEVFSPHKLKNVYMRIVVNRKFGSMYKQFMLDSTESLCDYLDGKPAVVMNLIFQYSKQSFFNLKCPLQGHFGLQNYQAKVAELFGSIPLGLYRIDVFFYEGSTLILSLKVFGPWTDRLKKIKHN